MKNYLIFLIINLGFHYSNSQTFSNFRLLNKLQSTNYSPDTLLYACNNLSVDVTLVRGGDGASRLKPSALLIADTVKIFLTDTATSFLWESATWTVNIRLWGGLPNPFKIKYLNHTYLINCNTTSINEDSFFPSFSIQNNVLKIGIEYPAIITMTNIYGEIVTVDKSERIDLNSLNLVTGIYVLQINSDKFKGRRKLYIEK